MRQAQAEEGLQQLQLSHGRDAPCARPRAILKGGSYRKHMDGLRARLARSMGEAAARLRDVGILPWIEPRGGIFLWCMLPEGLDAAVIARQLLAENIVSAPGNVYSLSQSVSRFMRFNVAQSGDPRLFHALELAMGKPARSNRAATQ